MRIYTGCVKNKMSISPGHPVFLVAHTGWRERERERSGGMVEISQSFLKTLKAGITKRSQVLRVPWRTPGKSWRNVKIMIPTPCSPVQVLTRTHELWSSNHWRSRGEPWPRPRRPGARGATPPLVEVRRSQAFLGESRAGRRRGWRGRSERRPWRADTPGRRIVMLGQDIGWDV